MLTSALVGLSLMAASGAEPAPAGAIAITVTGLRSDDGQVAALLYDQAKGFPTDPKRARVTRGASIQDRTARLTFVGVAPGTYAVAVLHDENKNGKLDTNFIGIPKEGVGASNNPKPRMGPPKYDDAKFRVQDSTVNQRIVVQYVL